MTTLLSRRTAVEDSFDELDEESFSVQRKPELEKSRIEELAHSFVDFRYHVQNYETVQKHAEKAIAGYLTRQDIRDFVHFIKGFEYREDFEVSAGCYLTAALRKGPERITLNLSHLPPLHGLCHKLDNREIVIIGDVGGLCGSEAKNSSITITGDTDKCVGYYMEQSRIEVHGTIADPNGVGRNMKDSTLVLHRSLTARELFKMCWYGRGSRIYIYGDVTECEEKDIGLLRVGCGPETIVRGQIRLANERIL